MFKSLFRMSKNTDSLVLSLIEGFQECSYTGANNQTINFNVPIIKEGVFLPKGGGDWAAAAKGVLGKDAYERFKSAMKADAVFGKDCLSKEDGRFFTDLYAVTTAVRETEEETLELNQEQNNFLVKFIPALATVLGSTGTTWEEHIDWLENQIPKVTTEEETTEDEQPVAQTEQVVETEEVAQAAEEVIQTAQPVPNGGAIVNAESMQAFITAMAKRSQATVSSNRKVMQAMQGLNAVQQQLLDALQDNTVAIQIDEQMWNTVNELTALPATTE